MPLSLLLRLCVLTEADDSTNYSSNRRTCFGIFNLLLQLFILVLYVFVFKKELVTFTKLSFRIHFKTNTLLISFGFV